MTIYDAQTIKLDGPDVTYLVLLDQSRTYPSVPHD